MELMVTLLFICGAISLGLISVGGGLVLRGRSKLTGRPMAATDYLTDPPKALDYGYIDFLERELEVGKYDPDRIAIEIESQVDEGMSLGLQMDEDDWREALTKYYGMSVDEIMRGLDYGTHSLIAQQAQARGSRDDWRLEYRTYVIGEIARRKVRDYQLSRKWKRFGDAARASAEFFRRDEAKPAREWAGRGVRTRLTQDPIDDGGHAWVDNALAELGVKAKPVDDSWADESLRDGVYGPRATEAIRSHSRGGLSRDYIDRDGNRTNIRSWGN